MTVNCPDCRSVFRVDPAKVPATGVRARCSVCGGVIAISGGTLPIAVTPSSSRAVVPTFAAAQTPPASTAMIAAPAPRVVAFAPGSAPARAQAPQIAAPVPPTLMTPPAPAALSVAVSPLSAAPQRDTPPRETPLREIPLREMPLREIPLREMPLREMPLREMPLRDTLARDTPLRAITVPPAAMTPAPRPAVTGASSAPVTPGGGKRSINPFLNADPGQRARRLARALVSDLVAYHPQKRDDGLRDGTLRQLFREEIKKSYEEYVEQVGREIAEGSPHFQDALNEILGGGRRLF